ncbi:MAG: phosphatidate cytidylyltransferase [Planctomycetia bacterium]|nr:phosphatidate cytidylyltransferase [Planctomycetia bacterium]
MSPEAALHSDVFLTYLAILLGLLAVAGGVIGVLGLLGKDVGHTWRAYRGWLVMIPLVLACVFLGRLATVAFFTLVAIVGFKEFARATGLYRDWWMTGVVYAGILGSGVFSAMTDPVLDRPGWYGMFVVWPAFVITLILLVPILRNRSEGQLQAIALALLGFLYIGWMFGHVGFLANSKDAYGYLFYLIFAVEVNDVAAFTFGRTFGRHPLRSNISPKKTWEGSLGALAVSMVLPWLLWKLSFPHFTPRELILSGLIVGVGGQLGDLAMSVIKRDLGIKDMGALIGGHGGILDRIDSLICVAPLWLNMARYFHEFY